MTRARDLANIIAGGFDATDIPNLDASKITTGTFPNSRLTNNSITINGSATALGGSVTIDAGVSWESKNANFTAVAGKAYYVDTSSSAITATLPSSASIDDEIRFLDISGTFNTNKLTIARNSHKIQGIADDLEVTTDRAGFSLIYYNATQGWLITEKG